MIVGGRVGGALLGSGDGTSQQGGINMVGGRAGVLVECEHDQGTVDVEVGVGQERGEPVPRPASCYREAAVVSVIGFS